MVAPLATPGEHRFKQRSGALHIIAPENEEFTTDGLRAAIHKFLRNAVTDEQNLSITNDIRNRRVCHPNVEAATVQDVVAASDLRTESITNDAISILKFITSGARLSSEVGARGTPYIGPVKRFKNYLENRSEGYDIAVPFFIPSDDDEASRIRNDEEILEQSPELEGCDEFIRTHYLTVDDGSATSCDTPPPFGLSW